MKLHRQIRPTTRTSLLVELAFCFVADPATLAPLLLRVVAGSKQQA